MDRSLRDFSNMELYRDTENGLYNCMRQGIKADDHEMVCMLAERARGKGYKLRVDVSEYLQKKRES